eukprot:3013416-Amphidinium_carterae.1
MEQNDVYQWVSGRGETLRGGTIATSMGNDGLQRHKTIRAADAKHDLYDRLYVLATHTERQKNTFAIEVCKANGTSKPLLATVTLCVSKVF